MRTWNTCLIACAIVATLLGDTHAQTPLHKQIDGLIGVGNPEFEKTAAAPASDAEFVRRIYLDLTGRIPTAEQTRAFLAEKTTQKRAKLIDRLLDSPEHARHLQNVFDVMLMERRASKHVKSEDWQKYLRQSFAENKPWDQLVTEILTVDGTDKKTRPAARFLLDREFKTDEVTRDLGRIFLGRDLQCAQCHDHPVIPDYLQRHYYGLSAFLNRSYLFTDPKLKKSVIGEKADGTVKFTSVFTEESGETQPRLLDLPSIDDPAVAGDPYVAKPDKKTRGVPIYSRRLKLAAALTDPSNIAFRQNIANRLWAMMLGRGLVEPVDMWHDANPPSHPELLDLLGETLAAHDYDVRFLLRELALTQTYQRGSEFPEGVKRAAEDQFAVALLKPLSPEQLAWSMMQATGLTTQTLETLKAKLSKDDQKKADDPGWQEEALQGALKGHVAQFVTFFGVKGIQTSRFDASANQALFLKNGSLLQSWLIPKGPNLTGRLGSLESPELIDEFFLAVFSRFPSEDERQQLAAYLKDNKQNREAAIRELAWAALASAEFRFNH